MKLNNQKFNNSIKRPTNAFGGFTTVPCLTNLNCSLDSQLNFYNQNLYFYHTFSCLAKNDGKFKRTNLDVLKDKLSKDEIKIVKKEVGFFGVNLLDINGIPIQTFKFDNARMLGLS
jgi:hypothetical protein